VIIERRPDPDQLLAHVQAQEARAKRGRLRIFFGASAGVGKTYAMLEAARSIHASGTDVVVGYLEPHGRVDTERLLVGLEQLPTLAVQYRGMVRNEFDLDAALARRPTLVLVDELAHSNLVGGEPPLRHPKRWQDIDELLDAGWTVVYVETPELMRLSDAERNRRIDLLRLAESLGAETVTLDGPSAAATLLEYAKTRNATRVIVGAPKRRGWRSWLHASTPTQLINHAHTFDVITIAAPERISSPSGLQSGAAVTDGPPPIRWDRYGWATFITAVCTGVAFILYPRFELSNLVMVYLLGVTIAGLRVGRGPSLVTALLNVVAFDFFFVPPRFTLAISDAQYLVTFGVMLTIALVIANLMASVRQQTRVAGARERRTALLYAMSRELAATRGIADMARVAVSHVAEVFQCQAVVLLPDPSPSARWHDARRPGQSRLRYPHDPPMECSFRGADLAVAQWVADHGQRAGLGSDTLAAAAGLYLPLGDASRSLGVLAVLPSNRRRVLLPEQRHLLETFASQIGLALERARLTEAAEAATVDAERESLRSTLLASISHDLRTPLAVMAGAGSTLAEHGATLDEPTRVSLARSIEAKAREMSDLVSNVLELMRFESGQVALRRDWQTLDDLVGTALHAVAQKLTDHPVDLKLPHDLPPVFVDATLVVQVFVNLLDNIAQYTPPGTRVHICAEADGPFVRVTVDDEGPGLPAGDPARLFDKFHRGDEEGTIVGVGLGLAICQAIVQAHGGEIEAQRRAGAGARFELTVPASQSPL
jgi:two-component system sensor histidine kinase KdpD